LAHRATNPHLLCVLRDVFVLLVLFSLFLYSDIYEREE